MSTCDTRSSLSQSLTCNLVSFGCCCSGTYEGSLCAECATGSCPASSGSALNSGAQNVETSNKDEAPIGAIVGGAVGGVVALLLIVGLVVHFSRKNGNKPATSGAAAPAAAPTGGVQITGGAADPVAVGVEVPSVPVQIPTEQTYTFNKATAETVCGITAKKSGDEVSIASLSAQGAAAGCGLEAGDVLLKINGFLVKTPEQAATLFKAAEGEVKVQVTRLVRQQSIVSDKI